MIDDEVRKRLDRLLHSQPLAVLATCHPAGPHAALVAIAVSDDLSEILFATARSTRKYEALQQDPRVALLVDDRSNEISDFRDASAATAHGVAHEVGAERVESQRRRYLDKHPHLEEFLLAPSCALIELAVESYDLVWNFQEVHILRMSDGPGSSG